MSRRRKAEPIFQLGKYWIDHVAGSSNYYRFWYDARTGEVRRRSLATADLEEAKLELAAHALQEGDGRANEPAEVTLISVFTRYWQEHSDRRPNPSAARRAGGLVLDFLDDNAAKVGTLTRRRQEAFIRWCHESLGHSVAYISRIQAIIAAALNRAVADDDDDEEALLTRAPKIIVAPSRIAEILDAPMPEPRNWHPDLHGLAAFLDAIPEEEETRLLRFAILMIAFAGRPEAIKELQPFQIDRRYRLVHLNPPGRRQTKKHRPTLPVPSVLWETLLGWCEEPHIVHNAGNRIVDLRKPWKAARMAAGLPAQFTPYALRHMVGTELRRRRVPREQREGWMGHRRARTNDHYGVFDPDYLADASMAIDALLEEIQSVSKRCIFRQVSAKSALRIQNENDENRDIAKS